MNYIFLTWYFSYTVAYLYFLLQYLSFNYLFIQGIPERGSYPSEDQDSAGVHPQAPSAPRLLQAIIASNRFITLAWHEPERNNDHIVGYSVFYRQEDSLR